MSRSRIFILLMLNCSTHLRDLCWYLAGCGVFALLSSRIRQNYDKNQNRSINSGCFTGIVISTVFRGYWDALMKLSAQGKRIEWWCRNVQYLSVCACIMTCRVIQEAYCSFLILMLPGLVLRQFTWRYPDYQYSWCRRLWGRAKLLREYGRSSPTAPIVFTNPVISLYRILVGVNSLFGFSKSSVEARRAVGRWHRHGDLGIWWAGHQAAYQVEQDMPYFVGDRDARMRFRKAF